MCRKLETEEEKILPFYASSLSEQEEKEIKQTLYENPSQDLADVNIFFLHLFQNNIESGGLTTVYCRQGHERLSIVGKLLETIQQSPIGQAELRQGEANASN